jgi:C-terminal processing protease CtpA/Prc
MTPDQSTPCARLCHIVKWDDFDGYGFNLHAEKGKSGQFIGKVDEGSPSEAAGLRQGDRIVEVNEINISSETHKQVVERIKAFPTETKLLVVDQRADDYFKANNVPIKGTMPGVRVLKTPERSSADRNEEVEVEEVEEEVEQEEVDEEEVEGLGCRPNGDEHKASQRPRRADRQPGLHVVPS